MKHYVVWRWHKQWVFNNWEECRKSIQGFSNARYKKFDNKEYADKAYKEWFTKYWGIKNKSLGKEDWLYLLPKSRFNKAIINQSIVVDWACQNSTTWDMEYQWIDMSTGEYIISSKVYTWGTNNIAEFLALYEAIKYARVNKFEWVIFSDSKIAISWVKRKVCNTNYTKLNNPEIIKLIQEALEYLKSNEEFSKIYRWDTKSWGENPADYGRK